MKKQDKIFFFVSFIVFAFCFLNIPIVFAEKSVNNNLSSNFQQEIGVMQNLTLAFENLDVQNRDSLIALQNALPSYQQSLEDFLAFYRSPEFLSAPVSLQENSVALIAKTQSAIDMVRLTNSLITSLLSVKDFN